MADTNSSSGGIGFVGLLALLFIALKLLDKIDWPWLWVLSPLWISIGLWAVVLLGILIFWLVEVLVRRLLR